MKILDLFGRLAPYMNLTMSEGTELLRALKEGSAHFNEDTAGESRVDPDILKGRPGPGGGVEADPFRAAFLLIAIMVNGPRKEAARNTWMTWHLNQEGSVLAGWGEDWKPTITVCPLTGQHLFGDAIKTIIENQDIAARVSKVHLSSDRSGEIHFDDGTVSKFHKGHNEPRYFHRGATVDGIVLQAMAQMLRHGS